jgi:hypothetical protein
MMTETGETEISAALLKLRETTAVPPADPERERMLLAAFDAHWTRPRRAFPRSVWVWTAAAASVAIALGLGRHGVTDAIPPAPITSTAADPAADLAGFVPWPGANALPPLESGELRRVDLLRSALPALGLSAPPSAVSVVPADIVIGQDGLVRAVRLVQQQ